MTPLMSHTSKTAFFFSIEFSIILTIHSEGGSVLAEPNLGLNSIWVISDNFLNFLVPLFSHQ